MKMAAEAILNFVLVIFVLLCLFVLYDYLKKKQFLLKNAKNIPYLPYLPGIGSVHLLYKEIGSGLQTVAKGLSIAKSDHFIAFMGHIPVYFTIDADDYQKILPNVLDRGIFYSFVDANIEGYSLLGAQVSEWRVDRKIMSKSFKERSLNRMIPVINESAEKHFSLFSRQETGQPIVSRALRYVMEGFLFNFFPSYELDGERSFTRILNSMKACIESPYIRFTRPWLFPKMFYEMSSLKKHINYLNQQANIDAINAIEKTRRENLEGAHMDSDDIITNLEKAGITDNIILSEFKVLTSAATHTTSMVLSIALMALGIYPEYQEKVCEEVLRVVGPTDSIEKSHIQDLKFTEMFVKEVLRMYPSVPLIMRKTVEPLDLGDGRILPKGMDICMSFYSIHRNEKYWKNPHEFNPYRFLPEEVEKRHPWAYLPFSAGPRNCIGYKYAWNVLVISTALFARKYKTTCSYKSVGDIEVKSFMVLDMVDDKPVCTFTPRQLASS